MSKEQNQDVPSAETQKPEESSSQTSTPTKQVSAETSQEQPFVLIEVPTINKKTMALAKTAGIDLAPFVTMAERINQFAGAVIKRIGEHDKYLEQMGLHVQKLIPLEQVVEKMQQSQKGSLGSPAGSAAGGEGAILLELAGKVMAASASNPLQEKFDKFLTVMIDRQLDQLTKPSLADAFSKAFDEEYIKMKAKAAAIAVTTP